MGVVVRMLDMSDVIDSLNSDDPDLGPEEIKFADAAEKCLKTKPKDKVSKESKRRKPKKVKKPKSFNVSVNSYDIDLDNLENPDFGPLHIKWSENGDIVSQNKKVNPQMPKRSSESRIFINKMLYGRRIKRVKQL
ncbi:hypothetical protein RF11_13194 [Thelohanellus kitauei]|uniref:Uncharacterized protein n=1 Tax=Thelohanellus kitauei TaxID=669202 RepID=A0A0C2JQS0_THEKT|nr:hypothetical protein RF11_03027 [Thelohanellus kitauei]KII71728.1 hypothetical protein RF11_13194 [Thelohanellus kitauei]